LITRARPVGFWPRFDTTPMKDSSMPIPDDVQVPEDVFKAARLADLAYLKFENLPTDRDHLRESARLLGYDQVEFCCNEKTDAQAFIAFDSHNRQAMVVFRGSERTAKDWFTNLDSRPGEAQKYYGREAYVHRGYYQSVDSIYDRIHEKLEAHHVREVAVAGHSQGGGDAQVAAPRLAALAKDYHVTRAYLYEAPSVSDGHALSARFNDLKIHPIRVEQRIDIVPRLNSAMSVHTYNSLKPTPGTFGPDTVSRYEQGLVALGGETAVKFIDPYAGKLDGDYYYINSQHKVWHNPAPTAVMQDRFCAAAGWAAGEIRHSADPRYHHEIAPIADHFGYDRNLFLSTSPAFQQQWRERLVQEKARLEHDLNKPGLDASSRANLLARRTAVEAEQTAVTSPLAADRLKHNLGTTSITPEDNTGLATPDQSKITPIASPQVTGADPHQAQMQGLIDLAAAIFRGGARPQSAQQPPTINRKQTDLMNGFPPVAPPTAGVKR
jgi:Lipase (class 3)